VIWNKRRSKLAWTISVTLLLGALLVFQLTRGQVEEYAPGDQEDGIVDALARDVPENHPKVVFTDVAAEAGLVFEHFPATRTNRLPEDMGSGVALGDVDGDGWTDVFLVNIAGPLGDPPAADGAGRSRLFLGGPEGRFKDVTENSGIELEALGNGAAFCDVDSDGDLDLFVAAYGTCRLFSNEGGAEFVDVSNEAGLEAWEGFWSGVSVGDFDRDGIPEIYVSGYVIYDEGKVASQGESSQYGRIIPALINPSTFEPERNLLLVRGADGSYRDVAVELEVNNPGGRSLGALFTDIDGDGRDDLYVANDVSDNAYFVNDGQGGFIDRTVEARVGDYRGAMGLAAADYDGDLDVDLFVTHWVAQENALYTRLNVETPPGEERKPPRFFDDGARYGLGHKALDKVGWATRFFDYDNDGALDLFVINGHTVPLEEQTSELEPMRSQLFWQDTSGQGFFHEVGAVSGEFWRQPFVGRGGASLDYDLDGDEDLVVVLHGTPAVLLRNEGGNALPSVRVRLRQPEGNRFALGARVLITAGGRQQLAIIGSQGSYLSQHAVGEVAFGLGEAALVEELEVTWPDGTREQVGPFLPYSLIDWERGSEPSSRSFPGRRQLDHEAPESVADQRRFFELRGVAQEHRLAGRTPEAIAGYFEALRLWPGHGDCLYYLGNCLVNWGDEASALVAFERMANFEPQSSQAPMQIGFLRLPGGDAGLDDLEAAERAFERCHELNGEESRPALMLGVVAMLRNDLDRAEELLLDSGHLNPRSIETRWFSGRVAWLRGDESLAAERLEEARALAAARGAGDSKSNEGDTKTGAALTSEGIVLSDMLERWRSAGERSGSVDEEYGPR